MTSHEMDNTERLRVSGTVRKWRTIEDGALAEKFQSEEFAKHKRQNKTERENARQDVPLALHLDKEAQCEQDLRRSAEKQDEQTAKHFEQELLSRLRNERNKTKHDSELARSLQKDETSQARPTVNHDEELAALIESELNGSLGRESDGGNKEQEEAENADDSEEEATPPPRPPIRDSVFARALQQQATLLTRHNSTQDEDLARHRGNTPNGHLSRERPSTQRDSEIARTLQEQENEALNTGEFDDEPLDRYVDMETIMKLKRNRPKTKRDSEIARTLQAEENARLGEAGSRDSEIARMLQEVENQDLEEDRTMDDMIAQQAQNEEVIRAASRTARVRVETQHTSSESTKAKKKFTLPVLSRDQLRSRILGTPKKEESSGSRHKPAGHTKSDSSIEVRARKIQEKRLQEIGDERLAQVLQLEEQNLV